MTEAELAVIQAALLRDPVFNAYALADLQPRYAPHCRWRVRHGVVQTGNVEATGTSAASVTAASVTGDETAVMLFYHGLEPPIFMATGPQALIAQALAEEVELPPALYMSVERAVFDILQTRYDFGDDVRPMLRMVWDAALAGKGPDGVFDKPLVSGTVQGSTRTLRLVELTSDDEARLAALYAHGGEFAPDAFDGYQLDDGAFFGIEVADSDGVGTWNDVDLDTVDNANAQEAGSRELASPGAAGELVAAGGTHVVDLVGGVAAIGNMYTHPQWRGRGLARAVLSAIVGALQRQRLSLIVLNVDRRNIIARRFYENYGFRLHCEFLEGIGVLRDTQANFKASTATRYE